MIYLLSYLFLSWHIFSLIIQQFKLIIWILWVERFLLPISSWLVCLGRLISWRKTITDSRAELAGCKFWIYSYLSTCFWVSYLPSLCLSFAYLQNKHKRKLSHRFVVKILNEVTAVLSCVNYYYWYYYNSYYEIITIILVMK